MTKKIVKFLNRVGNTERLPKEFLVEEKPVVEIPRWTF